MLILCIMYVHVLHTLFTFMTEHFRSKKERIQPQLISFKNLQAQKQQCCCLKAIPATDIFHQMHTEQHAQTANHLLSFHLRKPQ